MCYFITVAVPGAKARVLEEAMPRGLAAHRVENRSVARQLPRSDCTYLITSGFCSCALFDEIGFVRPRKDPERLRSKYRKMGWSEAKIERAVASVNSSYSEDRQEAGLEPRLRGVLASVAEQIGELRVLAHWYDGELESEKFELHAGPTLTPEELREGRFAMPADQLLTVKAARR